MQIYVLFKRNRPVVRQVGVDVQLLRSLCTSKVEVAWKKNWGDKERKWTVVSKIYWFSSSTLKAIE